MAYGKNTALQCKWNNEQVSNQSTMDTIKKINFCFRYPQVAHLNQKADLTVVGALYAIRMPVSI